MNVTPENKSFIIVRVIMVSLCLIATVFSVFVVYEFQTRRSAALFATFAQESLEELETRFHRIESVLDGGAGLIRASRTVSAQEWSDYVATIQADRTLPKVEGIGWIAQVKKDDGSYGNLSNRLEKRGFSIHPPSDSNQAFVIQYMAPDGANSVAIGLDLTFDQNRRETLVRARETGQVALSKPLVLVQDDAANIALIIARPLFDDAASETGSISQTYMAGWVTVPFLANSVFSQLSLEHGRDFELTVYSGAEEAGDSLVFSPNSAISDPDFNETRTVQFYGQDLTFIWDSTPDFAMLQKSFLPYILGLVGAVIAALISVSTLTHARRTQKIEQAIEDQTRELKATVGQTKAIIDNAIIGFAFLDSEAKILSVNPAFLQMFEIDEPVLTGCLLRDLIPDFPTKTWEGTIFVTSRTNSGSVLNLKVQVNKFQNKSGRNRYVVMFDDVTKEQAITDDLREAEHRMSLALSTSGIGVFDIDLRTGQSVVSDSWVELMCLNRETMADNPQDEFFARVHPDDVAPILESHQRCIDGVEERAECEYRVQTTPGEWRWFKSSTSVAGVDENGVPNRLIGSQIDFTELHVANERLRTSRHQFKEVLENSPVPLAMLDEDGFFVRVNQALTKLAGYSEKDLVGRNFQTLIYDEDLKDILRALMRMRTEDLDLLKVETRCIDKSGRVIWMLLSVSRVRDYTVDGGVFIAQFVDISQRKETEKNNREFFANMSHELRTPLTSVKGAIDLVMGTASSQLPENVRGLLNIAQGNSERLAKLLNDLLDLEKVSTDRMNFNYAVHNIADIVTEAVNAATPIAETANVRFETKLPPDGLYAWIDAQRLEQVLFNLLSNAVKYSDAGQAVTVSLQERDGNASISVKDCGPGIPASYHDKVFQPFSQADSSATREKGGTGLGLSIAKSLVETMGGKIDFESAEGRGTEFWVCLPNGQVSVMSDSAAPVRLLHVQSDKIFAGLLEGWLGSACEVTNVGSVVSALAKLGHDDFDALILNRNAAGVESDALLCHLREKYPHVAIVSLSKEDGEVADDLVDLSLALGSLRRDRIVKKCLWAIKPKILANV